MNYLKRKMKKNGEEAVSPVVGVMLMLVVTIIIAAVVSGYAGGLISGQSKSPSLTMDVKISNTGGYIGSGFSATVLGVSEPINTANTRIVTSWTTTKKKDSVDLNSVQSAAAIGAIITGGNTSNPGALNVDLNPGMGNSAHTKSVAPFAIGTGVNNTNPTNTFNSKYSGGWFGNYTLQAGVNLFAYPYGSKSGAAIGGAINSADTGGYNGATPYTYISGGNFVDTNGIVDPTIAVLGNGWEQLRGGDVVNVKVIYTPTGAAIFNKDVIVTEG